MATQPPIGMGSTPLPLEIHTAQPNPPIEHTAAAIALTVPCCWLTETITSATTRPKSTPAMYGMTPVNGYSPRIRPPKAATPAPRPIPAHGRQGDRGALVVRDRTGLLAAGSGSGDIRKRE